MDSELLRIAADPLRTEEERWALARCPEVLHTIRVQAKKYGSRRVDEEDMVSEAVIGIFESLDQDRVFEAEKPLLTYVALRSRDFIVSSSRRTSPDSEAAALPGGKLFDELSSEEESGEAGRLAALTRAALFGYPDETAAECAWLTAQGLPAWLIGERLGLTAKEVGVLRAKFISDAKIALLERGERVDLTILGVHVDEVGISGVLLRGLEVIDSWTVDVETPKDLTEVARRLRHSFNRGANQIACNEMDPTDASVWLKLVCQERGVEWEEFDVASITSEVPGISDAVDGPRSLKMAYVAARAKRAENRLKMERYG